MITIAMAAGKGKPQKILALLKERFPDAGIQLKYKDNFQLLCAVILSAQCTDERVNKVTPMLFSRYKSIRDFADADIGELEETIRPTGFFRQKAKRIRESARIIIKHHNGKVPLDMKELLELPGVARKTANVVLQNAYGSGYGIVVDTHVKRVSFRLGLTSSRDPVRIEQDLMKKYNENDYRNVSDLLIFHGRYTCKAQKPSCGECVLYSLCSFTDKKKFSEMK